MDSDKRYVWHLAGAAEWWGGEYDGSGSDLAYHYGDGMGYGKATGDALGGGQYWKYKAVQLEDQYRIYNY